MTALRARALRDPGVAADCLAALLEPDPDPDATDHAFDQLHARRTVGGVLVAEALLSVIAIRKALQKE